MKCYNSENIKETSYEFDLTALYSEELPYKNVWLYSLKNLLSLLLCLMNIVTFLSRREINKMGTIVNLTSKFAVTLSDLSSEARCLF